MNPDKIKKPFNFDGFYGLPIQDNIFLFGNASFLNKKPLGN